MQDSSVLGQVMTAVRLYCYGRNVCLQHYGLFLPEHSTSLSTKHRLGICCPYRSPTYFRILLLNCSMST